MDFGLRQRVAAGPLADKKSLRPPGQPQDTLVHQRVVQHQVRGAKTRDCQARQQPGVAGARSDE